MVGICCSIDPVELTYSIQPIGVHMLNEVNAPVARSIPLAHDPELPRLAASAALEADLALSDHNVGGEFVALRKLLGKLPIGAAATEATLVPVLDGFDPLSQDLFRRAVAGANRGTSAKISFGELRRAADILVSAQGRLSNIAEGKDFLVKVRDFCLALSNYAAASHSGRIVSAKGKSPYRV